MFLSLCTQGQQCTVQTELAVHCTHSYNALFAMADAQLMLMSRCRIQQATRQMQCLAARLSTWSTRLHSGKQRMGLVVLRRRQWSSIMVSVWGNCTRKGTIDCTRDQNVHSAAHQTNPAASSLCLYIDSIRGYIYTPEYDSIRGYIHTPEICYF